MSETELRRTLAQLDADYCRIARISADQETRFDALVGENTQLRVQLDTADHRASELESLLQAVERERDTADVELAAVTADRDLIAQNYASLSELCTHLSDARIEAQRENNSLYAENRRLRDVIVHQAAQLAGCGE